MSLLCAMMMMMIMTELHHLTIENVSNSIRSPGSVGHHFLHKVVGQGCHLVHRFVTDRGAPALDEGHPQAICKCLYCPIAQIVPVDYDDAAILSFLARQSDGGRLILVKERRAQLLSSIIDEEVIW